MRSFEHFPEDIKCPICGTSNDKECVLIVISGTQDGNIAEAQPVHSDCLIENLLYYKDKGLIICRTGGK